MANLSEKTLALFFTRGLSLETWDKLGMLAREVKLYSALAGNFKEIVLFTYGTKKDLSYENLFPSNVKIVSKPDYVPAFLYGILLPFMQGSVLRKVDVIKTNQMDGSFPAVIAKKLCGARGKKISLVVRCGYEWLSFIEQGKRAWYKKWFATLVEKFAYKNADAIILTSHADKKFVMERFFTPSEKINVIPNFVDTDLFAPASAWESREKNRIIFVGRLEEQKNARNLFTALAGLPAHLVVVGKGSLEGELRNIAAESGLSVEFLGALPQADLAAEFKKSEIFAMPSLYEGSPKTLLEAMSAGLACIGGDNEGTREIVSDGANGLVSGVDTAKIRAGLERLLADDILKKQLGNKARETIVQKYALAVILEKETSVYQHLLAK